MYQISFYVPVTHVDTVKESIFSAGAGKIGHYQRCSFEYEGLGQFEPLNGSDPFIGEQGKLEKVREVKVEMVCVKSVIKEVLAALKSTHPYETPAYYVTEIVDI